MLRDYQRDLISQVYSNYRSGISRVLAQLPTGGGKTLTCCEIISDAVARGRQVVFMAHRQELIIQSAIAIEKYLDCPVGVIKAGYPLNPERPVQVASVQTLQRRDYPWLKPDLFVIDECHLAMANGYQICLERYQPKFLLGLTATPIRLDGKPLNDLFESMVCGPQVSELIEWGFLSPYRLFAAASQIKTEGIKTNSCDFARNQLAEAATSADVMGDLVRAWREFADGKKTIAFCVNVEHSQKVCAEYQAQGIRAYHLDGSADPNLRKTALQEFRDGKIDVLTNCNLFSEGLDIPGIEAVQILRPTKSLALYLQQVGRGLRTAPGKEHAIIIDHTQNWFTLGLPDDPRFWSLDGKPKTEKQFTRQVGELIQITERPEIEERTDKSIIIAEVVNDPTVNPHLRSRLLHFSKIAQTRGYKKTWIVHRLYDEMHLSIQDFRYIGRCFGYKPGWAEAQIKRLLGQAS